MKIKEYKVSLKIDHVVQAYSVNDAEELALSIAQEGVAVDSATVLSAVRVGKCAHCKTEGMELFECVDCEKWFCKGCLTHYVYEETEQFLCGKCLEIEEEQRRRDEAYEDWVHSDDQDVEIMRGD